MSKDKIVFNISIVHTARTWERIRLERPFEEMPLDNIESAEAIIQIVDEIQNDAVIQRFIKCKDYDNWDWEKETNGYGFSDTYIEHLAEEIIRNNYLN
jgi:hypothetical protein